MEQKKKKVLVAPLNWGLGHATRCVPVIRELIQQGAEVIVATDGAALTLLKQEFPTLVFIELPGYNIRYATGIFMPLQMLLQAPGIFRTIGKEHQAIVKIVKNYKIDIIISDNRYGLYHENVISVFITHQLNIQPTKGLELAGRLINRINLYYIKKFSGCWVPDEKDNNNLSGELSHGHFSIVPLTYIGPLSRFSAPTESDEKENKYDLAIILSGPEPQRSIFEELINKQLGSIPGKIIMVRGTEIENTDKKTIGTLTIVNHLPATELETAIKSSSLILCRSGYSGIMDLAVLGKNAILVPTPGQTEQEYLADYFFKKRIFYCVDQDSLDLKDAILKSKEFTGIKIPLDNYLKDAIQLLLENELV